MTKTTPKTSKTVKSVKKTTLRQASKAKAAKKPAPKTTAPAAKKARAKKTAPKIASTAAKHDLQVSLASLETRMKRADTLTRKSVEALEKSVMALDARTRKENTTGKAALTRRINQLSKKIAQRVDTIEADTARALATTGDKIAELSDELTRRNELNQISIREKISEIALQTQTGYTSSTPSQVEIRPPAPQEPMRDFTQASPVVPPAPAAPQAVPPMDSSATAIPYADPAYAEADPTMAKVRIGGESAAKFNLPKLTGRNLRVAALATGVAVVGLVAAKGVFGGSNDVNSIPQTAQNSQQQNVAPISIPKPDTSIAPIGNYADNKAVDIAPSSEEAKSLNAAAAAGNKVLFESGQGLPKNVNDAFVWYSIAAAQGDQFAKTRVEVLSTTLDQSALVSAAARAEKFSPVKIDEAANGIFRDMAWSKPAKPAGPKVSQVKQVQAMLGDLGYDTGGTDGAIGPKTRTAIMSFERANSLPETGRVNTALINRLELATGA